MVTFLIFGVGFVAGFFIGRMIKKEAGTIRLDPKEPIPLNVRVCIRSGGVPIIDENGRMTACTFPPEAKKK